MKIAIGFPALNGTETAFTVSLAALTWFTARQRPELEIDIVNRTSSFLCRSRTEIVQWAVSWGADRLFMLDADQRFPPDALLRLLDRNRAVVAANYPRKQPPHVPVATSIDGSTMFTTPDKAQAGALEEAAMVGLGCCLIDMGVLGALERQAKAEGRADPFPIFFTPHLAGADYVGEDAYFCSRLRTAGVQLFVDHGLSWEVGHVGTRVVTHQDTLRALALGAHQAAKQAS